MANEHEQPESLQINFAKGTDTGRSRDHNEDCVDAFSPPDPAQRRQKGVLFIVADGMGGHQAGEVASEGAVRVISQEYYADPDLDVRGSLTRAIKKANAHIRQQAQEIASRTGMGTTVVAAVARESELYLANVGDSRAYLMRQGKVNQVTQDHSFVAEQIRAGILTREEARAHPQRNVITRALGSRPDVQVDTYRGELRPGDTLLMCSDGLSEYVQEEDMQAVLGQFSPKDAVPRLIALANKRGGSDNISVVVMQVAPVSGATSTELSSATTRAAAGGTSAAAAGAITQPVATPARKGLTLPLIAGIAIVGLVIVGIAALAFFVVIPRFRGDGTATPTVTPLVTSTSAATATVTPQPTATLLQEQAVPDSTATPAVMFGSRTPPDGATVEPGDVTLSWTLVGALSGKITFEVKMNSGDYCSMGDESSCDITLPVGDYRWWVEALIDGAKKYESEHWTLLVRTPSLLPSTPVPTFTPTATISPPPPPTVDGAAGGDDGGGDGNDGGAATPPPR